MGVLKAFWTSVLNLEIPDLLSGNGGSGLVSYATTAAGGGGGCSWPEGTPISMFRSDELDVLSSIHGFLGGGLKCLFFDFILEEWYGLPKTAASWSRAGSAVALIRNVWTQVNSFEADEAQRA